MVTKGKTCILERNSRQCIMGNEGRLSAQAGAHVHFHKPQSYKAPKWLDDAVTQVTLHKLNKLSGRGGL